MRVLLVGFLVLTSMSAFADVDKSPCLKVVRIMRQAITITERQNSEVIDYLTNTGEYLVRSGQSLKAQINAGGRTSAETGSTLVYSGKQVLGSVENSRRESAEAIDFLNEANNTLEDCILKL